MSGNDDVTAASTAPDLDKSAWRTRVLAARRALDGQVRDTEADLLSQHVLTVADGCAVLAAYVPVGTEPGSLAMLDAVRAQGTRVLLPLTGAAGDPLDWAEYEGADRLVPAAHRLREPAAPALGPHAIAQAEVVLLPALAVDRAGTRLGRGAGCYDRSLPLASPSARLVAVVRAAEVVARLPREQHDIPVSAALTPAGLIRLGNAL
ncbi:5-formyltetrahydrofolate cyclo-ligase [Rhodococcus sp. X156]|uniref:5-formyltetrahydrofolate cyclo-ligase n=1 Tax=Rhodococcus sp. X156 TaxID=2499145 RepID=UPI000FDAC594|nr:5-formyltetrahydrofolate cyclo-ligase [Rhodococcus sp. X156]